MKSSDSWIETGQVGTNGTRHNGAELRLNRDTQVVFGGIGSNNVGIPYVNTFDGTSIKWIEDLPISTFSGCTAMHEDQGIFNEIKVI